MMGGYVLVQMIAPLSPAQSKSVGARPEDFHLSFLDDLQSSSSESSDYDHELARSVVLRPNAQFNGVMVFAATTTGQRQRLREAVTAWMAARPDCVVNEVVVTQSSDDEFHCIAISVFYSQS